MGRYRDAMEEELRLQGYSDRTLEAYSSTDSIGIDVPESVLG